MAYKILHIFNRYQEVGGEEIFVNGLSRDLESRHEVRHLFFDSSAWRKEGFVGKLTQPLRMYWNPTAVREVVHAIEDFKPDFALVHNAFPVGSLGCYWALQQRGVPIFQYVHNFRPFSVNGYAWAGGKIAPEGLRKNFWPEILLGSWQNSRLKTFCYAGALWAGHMFRIWDRIDGWIAISDFMRDKFIVGGIRPERIRTVRHGWNAGQTLPTSQKSAHNKRLLFLGRLTEEKGLRVLLQAWEQVERQFPEGELVIAGDGPLAGWLRDQVSRFQRLRLSGFVGGEEKYRLIASADAIVVPSEWWEPLGLVAYEAYDHGKPVLAAASGGLAEIVQDGQTGWLHEPGNADQLATQMIEMLASPEETARRGAAGKHWLEANTGMKSWNMQLDASFEELLSEAKAARVKSPMHAGR